MKTIAMINRPIHPVPPRKGAAVEWWMLQVAKRVRSYEPHIVSVAAPGYPAYERTGGLHFHRISIGTLSGRVFHKWLRVDPYPYAARVAKILRDITGGRACP